MNKTLLVGFDKVGDSPPSQILLLRDGDIGWKDIDGVALDEKQAAAIIASFERHGAQLPVDYEHASVVAADEGRPAPAAGWITGLSYVKGEGLYGDIVWNEKATQQIVSGEYKYVSPVILLEEGRITEVHSLALTNKPRTIDQKELMAASLGVEVMAKKKNGKKVALLGQDDAAALVPQTAANVEETPEQVTEEVANIADSVMSLKEAMINAGMDVPEDADAVGVITMAIELIASAGSEDEAAAAAKDAVSAVAASLGCDATKEALLAKLTETKGHIGYVKASDHKAAVDRLTQLEAKEKARDRDQCISGLVDEGKLNPNDDERMAWARDAYDANPESFVRLMAGAPSVVPVGRLTEHETVKNTTPRKSVISSARAEYANNPALGRMTTEDAYVNRSLVEAGLSPLSDKE